MPLPVLALYRQSIQHRVWEQATTAAYSPALLQTGQPEGDMPGVSFFSVQAGWCHSCISLGPRQEQNATIQ